MIIALKPLFKESANAVAIGRALLGTGCVKAPPQSVLVVH